MLPFTPPPLPPLLCATIQPLAAASGGALLLHHTMGAAFAANLAAAAGRPAAAGAVADVRLSRGLTLASLVGPVDELYEGGAGGGGGPLATSDGGLVYMSSLDPGSMGLMAGSVGVPVVPPSRPRPRGADGHADTANAFALTCCEPGLAVALFLEVGEELGGGGGLLCCLWLLPYA